MKSVGALVWMALLGLVLVAMMSVALLFIIRQSKEGAEQAVAQSTANNAIIKEIRGDLFIHSHASADRVCSLAQEIRYLIRISPGVKHHVLEHVDQFTKGACLFVPPHVSTTAGSEGG